MSVDQLEFLLSTAGWLHFLQLPAMALFQRHVLQFQSELGKLSPVSQRVARVVGGGIVLAVLGTGVVVVRASGELAAGGGLARAMLAFLGVFWGYRACCQLWYARVWPPIVSGRAAHVLLLLIFAVQTGLYLVGATVEAEPGPSIAAEPLEGRLLAGRSALAGPCLLAVSGAARGAFAHCVPRAPAIYPVALSRPVGSGVCAATDAR